MSSICDGLFKNIIHDANESEEDDSTTMEKECSLDLEFGTNTESVWSAFKEAREKGESNHKDGEPPSQEKATKAAIASFRNALEPMLCQPGGKNEETLLKDVTEFIKVLVNEVYDDTKPTSIVPPLQKITAFLRKRLSKIEKHEERIRSSTIADIVVKICGIVNTCLAGKILLVQGDGIAERPKTDFLAWIGKATKRMFCRGAETQKEIREYKKRKHADSASPSSTSPSASPNAGGPGSSPSAANENASGSDPPGYIECLKTDGSYLLLLVSNRVFDFSPRRRSLDHGSGTLAKVREIISAFYNAAAGATHVDGSCAGYFLHRYHTGLRNGAGTYTTILHNG